MTERANRSGSSRGESDLWSGSDEPAPASGVLPRAGRSPLLVAFVVCVFLALGFDAGLIESIALVVVAALGVVAGTCLLGTGSAWARVSGSTIVGSSFVIGSAAILDRAVTLGSGGGVAVVEVAWSLPTAILFAIGFGVCGVGFTLVVARGGWTALREATADSAVAAVLAIPVLAVVIDGRFLRSLVIGSGLILDAATATPAIALLSLQVLGLCTAALAMGVGPTVERLSGKRVPIPSLEETIDRVRSWPEIGYWLLVGYAALWFVPGALATIDAALASLGAIGRAVGALLQSGIGHGLLAGLFACCLSIAVGRALFAPVRYWLEPSPARTLSVGAGGFVVPVVALVGGTAGTGHEVGALSALSLLALVCPAVIAWVTTRAPSLFELSRSQSVGVATASLFAATMGLALEGLSPLGVLIGVATVLLAWDLGTHALEIHRSVGADVDASEPVAAHATTVIVIVALGVGLGGVAIVAATAGASGIDVPGAETTIFLLLVAVLVVATTGVRRPSVHRGVVTRLSSQLRAVPTPITLALWGIGVTVVLGWLVDPRLYLLTVFLLIGIPAALTVGPDGRRSRRPPGRF